jgi:hypothetical protein
MNADGGPASHSLVLLPASGRARYNVCALKTDGSNGRFFASQASVADSRCKGKLAWCALW